jgi:hypothetical protein
LKLFKRDIYQGPRDKDAMIRYAMSFVSANVIKLEDRTFDNLKFDKKTPWLISFCREIDEGDCLDDDQVYKLAVMLVRLIFNN